MLNLMRPDVINPPAIVVQIKDEHALKREWDEACEDEQDAVERKVAVLREALQRWPRILSPNPGQRAQGKMIHSPEMRRFVRDVLKLPDGTGGGMNGHATRLLCIGAEGVRARGRAGNADQAKKTCRRRRVEQAVIELTTKYRLGADPAACMDALVNLLEEKS